MANHDNAKTVRLQTTGAKTCAILGTVNDDIHGLRAMGMTLAFPLQLRLGKRSLRWSGGGLLLLVSLGLHGLLLGLPLAESDLASPDSATELDQPVEVPVEAIDVVRLPAAPETAAPGTTPLQTIVPGAIAPKSVPQTAAPQAARPVQPSAPAAPTAPASAPPVPVDLEPLPPEPPPQTLDDRLRDPAAYAFNNQAKAAMAEGGSLDQQELSTFAEVSTRLEEMAVEQGITDNDLIPVLGEKLAPLLVAYPLNTCLVPPPAEGMVIVVADTAGQPLQAPDLLYSTGYAVLDDKAMAMALERTFPAQSAGSPNPRGYWLPVQVQYDVAGCNS